MDGLKGVPDHLDKLHRDGNITTPVYHQCLVSLAHRYVMDDDLEAALVTLNRVPAAFLLDGLPEQCLQDQALAAAVFELSFKLLQLGVAPDLETARPNVLPAQA